MITDTMRGIMVLEIPYLHKDVIDWDQVASLSFPEGCLDLTNLNPNVNLKCLSSRHAQLIPSISMNQYILLYPSPTPQYIV